MIDFQYTYKALPAKFYSPVKPAVFPKPELVLLNKPLVRAFQLPLKEVAQTASFLSGQALSSSISPFAQAYAGHQFGHFSRLGDGRALVLGEFCAPDGNMYDLQLKGSGQTPYSRRGDGCATLRSMLREFLMSEAMHALGIPSSRSLSVVKTGEPVYREQVEEGAVLARIMRSHIRIGTFEYAAYLGNEDDLRALMHYAINRHFPALSESDQPALDLLEAVAVLQIDLLVHWMRVGFIHGVMNTDNVAISGETFDYGPCAFLNTYHPETVFSSIDFQGRYAFGNQPKILQWNLTRFAEALLPLIHHNKDKAIAFAEEKLQSFAHRYREKWTSMMCKKIGIENPRDEDERLLFDLLEWMQKDGADYTQTFYALGEEMASVDKGSENSSLESWKQKWHLRILQNEGGELTAKQLMKKNNPIFIPRNWLVESSLDGAIQDDYTGFHRLLEAVQHPYVYRQQFEDYLQLDKHYDATYQTYCGT